MTSFYPQIVSLFYSLLIIFTFFFKKKVNSIENSIFGTLLVSNFIGLILDIIGFYFIHIGVKDIFINLSARLILVYLVFWIFTMTIYIFISSKNITFNDKKDNNTLWNKYIRFKKTILMIEILLIIFCLLIPIKVLNDNGRIYTESIGNTTLYFVSTILMTSWIIMLLKNNKNIKEKKFYPMYAYIILGSFIAAIQYFNPSIILITPLETFITVLMYHTIENPDIKMLEEVKIAKEQAEKANHAKTDFLSSMSHEIRTPLNAIVGFSQALMEEDIPESAKEEAKDIMSASETLLELVNSILDISKIEANKIEIIEKEYNFKEMFDDLVSLTKARMGEKNLDFNVYYDSTIPPVLYGDNVRVKQIILNLLTNSVKYTKQGYIDFKVSSFKQNGVCRLIVSVEDSGIGIKKENIDRLFKKFERFDEKNTTVEGTGLGLAITKKLVELMRGKIIVQSIHGKGSKFTFIVDQKIVEGKTSLEPVVEQKSNVKVDLTTKRILLVDDNNLNIKVASRLLSTYKMQIDTCLSGFECIDKINAGEKYDLILLDDMMPKMSGVETLQKLKQMDSFNIPTVALTANAIAGMKEKYLADGFDDYLSKPIEKPELNRVIEKFLNK